MANFSWPSQGEQVPMHFFFLKNEPYLNQHVANIMKRIDGPEKSMARIQIFNIWNHNMEFPTNQWNYSHLYVIAYSNRFHYLSKLLRMLNNEYQLFDYVKD